MVTWNGATGSFKDICHMLKGFGHEGKGQSQNYDLALNGTHVN